MKWFAQSEMDKEYIRGLRNGKRLALKENYWWVLLQTISNIGLVIGGLLMGQKLYIIGFIMFVACTIITTFVGAKASGILNK